GLPRSDGERWCALALLNPAAAAVGAGAARGLGGPDVTTSANKGEGSDKPLYDHEGKIVLLNPPVLDLGGTGPHNPASSPDSSPDTGSKPPEAEAEAADKPRRAFHKMPRSQQAGVVCGDPRFHAWAGVAEGDTAIFVRTYCNVKSRAELDVSPRAKAA